MLTHKLYLSFFVADFFFDALFVDSIEDARYKKKDCSDSRWATLQCAIRIGILDYDGDNIDVLSLSIANSLFLYLDFLDYNSILDMTRSSVQRFMKLYEETGSIENRKGCTC